MNDILEILARNEIASRIAMVGALGGGLASATDVTKRLLTFRLNKFRDEVARRAELCRTKTGYIGALLARYTALITLNLLGFNVALNVANAAPYLAGQANITKGLKLGAYSASAVFALSVVVLVIIILAICREVMRRTEADR